MRIGLALLFILLSDATCHNAICSETILSNCRFEGRLALAKLLVLRIKGGDSVGEVDKSQVDGEAENNRFSSASASESAVSRGASADGRASECANVNYCSSCGVPEEYCCYIERCTRVKGRSNDKPLGKDKKVTGDTTGGGIMQQAPKHPSNKTAEYDGDKASEQKVSAAGGNNTETSGLQVAESGGQEEGGETSKAKGKSKSKKEKEIHIKVDKRRARKFVTTVFGMEHFMKVGETLKDAAKLLANTLAAGASAVKGTEGQPDHIVIQGDFAEKIRDFCCSKLKAPSGLVKIK